MRKYRSILMLLALSVTCLAGGMNASGQNLIPNLNQKTSDVLNQIPADATAYILINNLTDMLQNADNLIKAMGLENDVPSPLLGTLQGLGGLGEGFTPEKGLAVAVLNLNKFGFDPLVAMGMKQPAEGPRKPPIPPFAVYIPGKSIATTFPNATVQKNNGSTMISIQEGMPPMFVIENKGFIVISMDPKVLDAIKNLNIAQSAASTLNKKRATVAANSDLFVDLNWEVIGPLYNEMMEATQGEMKRQLGRDRDLQILLPLFDGYMKMIAKLMDEMTSLSLALSISDKAVTIEELVSFKSGGVLSQSSDIENVSAKKLLSGLPKEQYVVALSQLQSTSASGEIVKIVGEMIDVLDKAELPFELPQNTTGRLKKMVKTASEQITGIKMVGGGSGNAAFATAIVIKCKDAGIIKGLLSDKTDLLLEIVKAASQGEEDIKDLDIKYTKGVETIGGFSIDAIRVTHPELAEMDAEDKQMMQSVLGTTDIRILVASPDNKTVIVTFGGDLVTMGNMLKTKTSPLLDAEGVKAAVAAMPTELSAIVLISPGNLMEAIKNGMTRVGNLEDISDVPNLSSKAPLAIGVTTSKTDAHIIFRTPVPLIRDLVDIIKLQQQKQREMMQRWRDEDRRRNDDF